MTRMRGVGLFAIVTLCLLGSCRNPEEKYLKDFGIFINDAELNLDDYTDAQWAEVQYSYEYFIGEEFEKYEDVLTDSEMKQVESYKERFRKLEVKRDPIENILKVIGL